MNRKILVRFDDICPTMNWEQWFKAEAVLKKYNVKPLLGIIPDNQDAELKIDSPRKDYWEYIHSLADKGYVLAMHGYQHCYDIKHRGMVNTSFNSEFAGHPYETQLHKIREGKRILNEHGIDTDIFFAPSHSYDQNTLKALAVCGFKYISDGMSRRPIERQGVVCIPCRSGGVPKIKEKGYYTAIFHAHEWVRPEKYEGYSRLCNLCKTYSRDIVSFDDYNTRKTSGSIVNKVDEWFYIKFQRHIRPSLSRIKHIMLKR
jgi:predicted deacetylase